MLENAAYISGPLFLISGAFQTVHLLRRRTSDDISVGTYICTWSAILLVIVSSHEQSVLFANITSWLITSTNLFLILLFRRKHV